MELKTLQPDDELVDNAISDITLLPELAPSSKLPDGVKKSTLFIHLQAISGDYSHMARRVFNGILALSFRQWKNRPSEERTRLLQSDTVVRFQATLSEVRGVLELAPTDHGNDRIYDALEKLRQLRVRWNTVEADGLQMLENAGLLAQWARSDPPGRITWSFLPDVMRIVMHPARYAIIDLKLSNGFGSGAALALYENTYRYVNNPGRLTAKLTVPDWLGMLCGPDKYTQGKNAYSDFKRFVLLPAMEELQTTPSCDIWLELLESKVGRKVTHLQFVVHRKEQTALHFEENDLVNEALLKRIANLGVTEAAVRKLAVEYEDSDLERALAGTEAAMRKAKVSSPAGFFMAALKNEYHFNEVEEQQRVAEVVRGRAVALEDKRVSEAFSAFRSKRVRARFEAMPPSLKDEWQHQWDASPEAQNAAKSVLGRRGKQLFGAHPLFFAWLLKQEGILVEPEETSELAFSRSVHAKPSA